MVDQSNQSRPSAFPPRRSGYQGKNPSLKQGFAKEEGAKGPSDKHEVKKRKRGPMGGAFQAVPRMSAYKHVPFRKTGTDKDTLEGQGDERLKVMVIGGNEEVGRNCTVLE